MSKVSKRRANEAVFRYMSITSLAPLYFRVLIITHKARFRQRMSISYSSLPSLYIMYINVQLICEQNIYWTKCSLFAQFVKILRRMVAICWCHLYCKHQYTSRFVTCTEFNCKLILYWQASERVDDQLAVTSYANHNKVNTIYSTIVTL